MTLTTLSTEWYTAASLQVGPNRIDQVHVPIERATYAQLVVASNPLAAGACCTYMHIPNL